MSRLGTPAVTKLSQMSNFNNPDFLAPLYEGMSVPHSYFKLCHWHLSHATHMGFIIGKMALDRFLAHNCGLLL